MDPRDPIRERINRAYGYAAGYRPPFYIPYFYCGRYVDEMGDEEASNIVQTSLTYPA